MAVHAMLQRCFLIGVGWTRGEVCIFFFFFVFFFFFFLVHRLSTPVGAPNLSMKVKTQPTYLALGVDF